MGFQRLKLFTLFALSFVWGPAALLCANAADSPGWFDVGNKRRVYAAEGTKFNVVDGDIELNSGSLIVESFVSATIKMSMAEVHAGAKSLIEVRARPGCEHIFVLLGNAPVQVGRHSVLLKTSEEAIITDHEPAYLDLSGEDNIGRRRMQMVELPDAKTFVVCEFSLPHAVERDPLVLRMTHSADSRDRALKDRLLKTAAVLNIVTARHGQYSTGAH